MTFRMLTGMSEAKMPCSSSSTMLACSFGAFAFFCGRDAADVLGACNGQRAQLSVIHVLQVLTKTCSGVGIVMGLTFLGGASSSGTTLLAATSAMLFCQ